MDVFSRQDQKLLDAADEVKKLKIANKLASKVLSARKVSSNHDTEKGTVLIKNTGCASERLDMINHWKLYQMEYNQRFTTQHNNTGMYNLFKAECLETLFYGLGCAASFS